jgi:TolA-binding protein
LKVDRYDYPRWQAGALLQAGKCQELLGQQAEAVKTYGRLVERFPDSELGDEARRRLSVAAQRGQSRR